jgi:signal peptidase II
MTKKPSLPLSYLVWFAFTFATLISIDQFLKNLTSRTSKVIYNPGISFGFFQLPSDRLSLFLIVLILFISLISIRKYFITQIYKIQPLSLPQVIAFALIISGALSNLLDRFLHGSVIDYLYLPLLNIHNNLADWGIFVGIAMLFLLKLQIINSHVS